MTGLPGRRPAALSGGRRPGRGPAAGHVAGPGADPASDPASDPAEPPADPESVARALCLRALTGAPKTRRQLADMLARRDVPEAAAEAVLDRFVEVGLIDDAAFARAWVDSRQSGRGLARRALQAELKAKGVDADVAAQAVETVDADDERAAALQLVQRRARSMQRLDRATATRRLIGMLARKGYGGGMAAAVVREVLDAVGAEPDESDFEPL